MAGIGGAGEGPREPLEGWAEGNEASVVSITSLTLSLSLTCFWVPHPTQLERLRVVL